MKEQSELTPSKHLTPNIGGVYAKDRTEVKLLQPSNAFSSIEVMLLGMVIAVKLLQLQNAPYPIVVTLLGIFTDDFAPGH